MSCNFRLNPGWDLLPDGEDPPKRASLIRDQVQKILASSGFVNSARMCQFLHFVVENSLSGKDPPKETLIGTEVFSRTPDYDPGVDPIVRVEARRLRDKLAQYYQCKGAEDTIVIGLPKGGYTPVFEIRTAAPAESATDADGGPGEAPPSANRPPHSAGARTPRATPPRDDSSHSEIVAGFATQRRRVLAVALAVVLGAFGYAVYRFTSPAGSPGSPFRNFTITQLTSSGEEVAAAISPDGKYILSARENNRLESLWLRNVATASDVQVIAPAPAHYANLAFSPDGNYIYYKKLVGPGAFNLFRAPVLGGTPRVVVYDIDSNVTLSPDGRRMAWVRLNDPVVGQGRLLSTSVDGSGEKTLYWAPTRRFSHRVAWSPDGRRIATSIPRTDNALPGLAMFDLASGSFRTFATFKNMDVHSLAWIPDGSGLLISYGDAQSDYRLQIGFLSYPGAKFSPITRDTNRYPDFTVSADGKTIATVQQSTSSDLGVFPSAGSEAPSPAPVLSVPEQILDYSWDGNSSLLLGKSGKLLRVSADGKTISSLISNPGAVFHSVAVCAGGRLVFSMGLPRGGSGPNVWRAAADGTDPVQLTDGNNDYGPVCSADSKWVYYFQFLPSPAFKRVPLSGGQSQDMPQWAAPGMVIDAPASQSADGRDVAFLANADDPTAKDTLARMVLLSLDSGLVPRFITPDPRIDFSTFWQSTAEFTPDGKALAYPIRQNGADNIWVQPLDGSSGRQITHLTAERIFKFSWSPDGKHLAVLRTRSASNVILLRAANP